MIDNLDLFKNLESAVRQDAKHGRPQISTVVRQSPARARCAPAKHASIHGRHVMSVATLSMSQQGIDKVQCLGHFEEKQDVYDLVHNRR